MRTFLVYGLTAATLLSTINAAEKAAQPDPAKLEEMTRLQIFLDRANFGPGKIDGRGGEFTRKALELYRSAQGAPAPIAGAPAEKEKAESKRKKADEGEKLDTTGIDLNSVGDPFTTYTVTKEDIENVADIPKDPAAQAKLPALPYRSALEAVAERFHSDIDFIKELNSGVKVESLKEGDTLKVPNVEPFDLASVKQIKPGETLQQAQAGAEHSAETGKSEEKSKSSGEKEKDTTKEKSEDSSKVSVLVKVDEKMLEVHEGDRLLAAFPVTPGSDDIPSPTGEWKVKGVATMPDFRYDKKMLKEGERSENAHMLKPGPNNPVGVVWIALNKPGIGIHGTDEPDTIGRAASHGCIRLANWDAVKVARMVKGGVPVTIK